MPCSSASPSVGATAPVNIAKVVDLPAPEIANTESIYITDLSVFSLYDSEIYRYIRAQIYRINSASPSVGATAPVSIAKVVDLPAPETANKQLIYRDIWKYIYRRWSRRELMPCSSASPSVGATAPVNIAKVVDFPAPETANKQ